MKKEKLINTIIITLTILLITIVALITISEVTSINILTKVYVFICILVTPITFIYNIGLKIAVITFLILGSIYFYKGGKKR